MYAIALALGAMIAGCDGAGPDQAATSSETQTALQAFADSLSTVRTPADISQNGGTVPAARRGSMSDSLSSGVNGRFTNYSRDAVYLWAESWDRDAEGVYMRAGHVVGARQYLIDSVTDGPEGPRQRHTRIGVTSTVFWQEEDMVTAKDSLWLHGEGRTRWGLRWSFREMRDSDFVRLGLAAINPSALVEPRLYTFGDRWQVVDDGSLNFWQDRLPLFRDGVRVGDLVKLSATGSSRPIFDWSVFTVVDLEGREYTARSLGKPGGEWPYDSLGLILGNLAADGSGGWSLPYRWNFLPGTARTLAAAMIECRVHVSQNDPWLRDQPDPYAARIPMERFDADQGRGTLRLSAIAPEARRLQFDFVCLEPGATTIYPHGPVTFQIMPDSRFVPGRGVLP